MQAQANDDQLKCIKLHLIIPLALTALELDIKAIEPMSFGNIYIAPLRMWQDRLSVLLSDVNIALRRDGIKVHLIEQSKEFGLRAEYWIGGYKYSFTMIPRYIRAEIETLIREVGEK